MKKYNVSYIFHRCSTYEESHFRAQQFRKYGYIIICSGIHKTEKETYYTLIVTKDKIRNSSDIIKDNKNGTVA